MSGALKRPIFKERAKKYRILSPKDLIYLKAFFTKIPYPSKTQIQELSSQLGVSTEKVRNWFKHQRKKEVLSGRGKFERKNSFSKEKLKVLEEEFEKNRKPSSEACEKLAQLLNCKPKNVRHWFNHKRKLSSPISRTFPAAPPIENTGSKRNSAEIKVEAIVSPQIPENPGAGFIKVSQNLEGAKPVQDPGTQWLQLAMMQKLYSLNLHLSMQISWLRNPLGFWDLSGRLSGK